MIKKISQLNHPSFWKFIGLSLTVIVTELAANRRKNVLFRLEWKQKKIINIYGMSYLHLNDIIHCDLKPENIFLDDFWKYSIRGKYDLSVSLRT